MILRRLCFGLIIAVTATLSSSISAQPVSAQPASAVQNVPWDQLDSGNCLVTKDNFGFTACPKGDLAGTINVGLIGDSHMRQYFAPLDYLAYKYHWHVTYISKSACPVGDASIFPTGVSSASCKDWNGRLTKYLAEQPPFDLIVNSNSSLVTHGNKLIGAAFAKTVTSQTARGTIWLTIRDNPKPNNNFLACIAKNVANAAVACARTRAQALTPADVLVPAIKGLPNVVIADFTNAFCKKVCPPVIQNTVVYRDHSHISSNFARKMVHHLEDAIPARFKQPALLVTQ